jgi:hypothetical protein
LSECPDTGECIPVREARKHELISTAFNGMRNFFFIKEG